MITEIVPVKPMCVNVRPTGDLLETVACTMDPAVTAPHKAGNARQVLISATVIQVCLLPIIIFIIYITRILYDKPCK